MKSIVEENPYLDPLHIIGQMLILRISRIRNHLIVVISTINLFLHVVLY